MKKLKVVLAFPNVRQQDILQTYTGNMAKNIYETFISHFNDSLDVFLDKELFRCIDTNSPISDKKIKELSEYDAILVAGLKTLDRSDKNISFISEVKKLAPNIIIAQLGDSILEQSNADITFGTLGKLSKRNARKNAVVKWAANKHAFTVTKKPKETLNIFIDHTMYVKTLWHTDRTVDILQQIKDLDYTRYGYSGINVFRIGNGELITDINAPVEMHDRNGLDNIEYRKMLSVSDIFFVTHPESVGLSALEAGMSGCTVISPEGYIKKELIKTINHNEFKDDIDWDNVFPINRNKNRKKASAYDFIRLCNKIVSKLKEVNGLT